MARVRRGERPVGSVTIVCGIGPAPVPPPGHVSATDAPAMGAPDESTTVPSIFQPGSQPPSSRKATAKCLKSR